MFNYWSTPPSLTRISILLLILGVFGCSSPEERAKSYYERGLSFLQKGDPSKASLDFRNALKIKDDYIPALFSLGQAEEQLGHFDNAVRIYLNVAERDSKHVDARLHLTSISLAAGLLDVAAKFSDQAYALASSNAGVLALKAV